MSGTWQFFANYAFDLFSVAGIILGLAFTAASFRSDTKSRRVGNLITLTTQHRDIWERLGKAPSVRRVLEPVINLGAKPITEDEAQFVVLVILHLFCWHRAVKSGEVRAIYGAARDVEEFFKLPIPAEVWRGKREYYDTDFVHYVDSLLRNPQP